MFQEFTRNMTELERQELLDILEGIRQPSTSAARTIGWIAMWTTSVAICGAVEVALFKRIGAYNLLILSTIASVVAVALIICVYAIIALTSGHLRWARVYRNARRERVPLVQRALARGMVSVKKVAAVSVVVIEPFELDEDMGYIFDLGDRRVLFLKGQEYFPVRGDMEWPNSEFEIVRTETEDLWVGVFCYGGKLSPIDVIPVSSCREDVICAHHEEVLDGNLKEFCETIVALA